MPRKKRIRYRNSVSVAHMKLGVFSLFLILGGLFIFFTQFTMFYKVTASSMQPQYEVGKTYLVNKTAFISRKPAVNDIILFKSPVDFNTSTFSRIVALPGDNIRLHNGKIWRNNVIIEERYLSPGTATQEGAFLKPDITYVLPKGYYAVLNDNRSNIHDSREWGFISENLIIGGFWR